MIVCQCKGITDQCVRKAVRAGAVTVEQVGLDCSAGADCGGCRDTIALLVREELRRTQQPVLVTLPSLATAS